MAEGEEKAGHYFLSYSRSDEEFALKLAGDLRAGGVSMWVDQLDIRPSQHWDRAIERAVRDCRGILVVLSPRSVASDNVADEISFAIDSGKSVLPVMIERCTLPLRITRMQVVDATRSYEDALRQCLAELRDGKAASGPQSEPSASPRPCLDSDSLETAKLELTAIVGPIAGVLVGKAAERAQSVEELYRLLSLHIRDEDGREKFLASVASSAARPPALQPRAEDARGPIPTDAVDALAKMLTRYVGPIAPRLAKRESQGCGSIEELRQRLASFIPRESERTEFLREAQSA
jgi:hypothetical protein